jgi:Holliday junction DNA helicase RuvB
MDRRLLGVLIERFHGGPAGVEALAAGIGEDRGTIEDVYEPFLVRAGYVLRTPRGRVAGPAAYSALGLKRPGKRGDNPQLEGLDT